MGFSSDPAFSNPPALSGWQRRSSKRSTISINLRLSHGQAGVLVMRCRDLMFTPSGMMRCYKPVDVKIGVLALQGNVSEHIDAFRLALGRLGQDASSEVSEVRHPEDLAG